jgi:hypothetical protein
MDGTNGTLASGVTATAISEAQSEQLQQNGNHKEEEGFKLKFCTVCASNQNR